MNNSIVTDIEAKNEHLHGTHRMQLCLKRLEHLHGTHRMQLSLKRLEHLHGTHRMQLCLKWLNTKMIMRSKAIGVTGHGNP
jgi:hypothetical protein